MFKRPALFASPLSAITASLMLAANPATAGQGAAPAKPKVDVPKVYPPKVYAIVTVTLKPGQDDAFVALLPADAARQKKAGLHLVASYRVQFGVGNRHIVIWEAESADVIRRAAFETTDDPAGILDIVEREDIEIAVRDPLTP